MELPTPEQLERLAILAEECAEVIQIIGKIQRHGYNSWHPDDKDKVTNRFLLSTELGHVQFATRLLVCNEDVSEMHIQHSKNRKAVTIQQYLHQEHEYHG